MTRFSRRAVLSALLGTAASPMFANAPASSLRPRPRTQSVARASLPAADNLIAQARLTGDVGFVVADARTGKVLEHRNGSLKLPPASVTKAITAVYALEKLGAGFRYKTQLLATGPVSNGRLKGDLILAGGGDPTLDTDGLGEMAQQLRAIGVKEVSGRFRVYGGALPRLREIDDGQPPHVSYNPALSGLNLNFNRVHFEWKRQSGTYSLKLDARAKKFAPEVRIARVRVAERSLPIYTYSDQGNVDSWTVARPALGNGGSRWLPVRKPELYAAEVFRSLARAQGISLPQGQPQKSAPRGTVLVEHRSAQLQVILRDMLRFSTNLTAEVVGMTASGSKSGSLRTSARKMTTWAKQRLGLKGSKFVDHSGLGGDSRLSADEMVKALIKTQRATQLTPILKDIPMRNRKGEILRNHPVKIRAKTGTLNFASALAGYMTARDGRQLVFAIFSADVSRRNKLRASDGELPDGAAGWRKRARFLQLQLIDRWGAAYTA